MGSYVHVNVAKSGFFTTDRTMRQYNEDIWKVEPIVTEVE